MWLCPFFEIFPTKLEVTSLIEKILSDSLPAGPNYSKMAKKNLKKHPKWGLNS